MRLDRLALAFVLTAAASMPNAQTRMLSAQDYDRAVRFLPDRMNRLVDGQPTALVWNDDGTLTYRLRDANSDRTLRDGEHPLELVQSAALAQALTQAKGKPVPVNAAQLAAIRAEGADWRLRVGEDNYRCDKAFARCTLLKSKGGEEPAVTSPDGRRAAFIRNWNLWLRDTATGQEWPLTTDGSTDYGYATSNAGWQHGAEAVLVWSPDSKKIATFRQDQRRTSTMTLVHTNVGAPKVEQWKYPFVGDKDVTLIERVVIDVANPSSPTLVRLNMPPDQHRSTFCDDISCDGGWEDVQWGEDGRTLAFVSTDRGHKSATLRLADPASGAVRDVYTETVTTQFESGHNKVGWRYLSKAGQFLWTSEKSGWGHLYLHDMKDGRLIRQLTEGAWKVAQLLRVDEAGRNAWVMGYGREGGNPYFAHVYRVPLDGGAVVPLTPEPASHAANFAPDGRHFVDTYSTIATAPVTVLRDALTGRVVREIGHASLARLQAAGWRAPEDFTVTARDGKTTLWGQMFKPTTFDAAKKYPLIVYIYPGPQVGSVRTRSFAAAHGDHQALAELGFIVIALDGMGTPLRSKAFQDAYYGNMADNTLPDQVAAVKQLAARYPWVDGTRVGIWGHSGGGNATAGAMFRYPDVFKVGIAEAGNHDNLSYEDDWAERYHGLVQKNADGTTNYTAQDNASQAKNLQGRLLLIHGMLDDNVPVQNTLLVADALMKANKDFDLLLLPQARHGFGQYANYVMRRRWDYFVQYLMGATPPKEYEITPAQ